MPVLHSAWERGALECAVSENEGKNVPSNFNNCSRGLPMDVNKRASL